FKAIYTDYIVYEQHRHEFMNQPHARATLLHGGLVWRLAMHSFDIGDLPSILEGISWEAITFGLMLPINDQTYFNNELSEEEVDFMCGTYYLYNSDTMDKVSWWPRPQAWAASGLNVGFWSTRCEEWFQKHLDNIQEGVSRIRNTRINDNNGPMTTMWWRHSLKFNAGITKMMKNVDAACSQFL
ncbi:hypothetical protein EDB19DRAFT_1583022, partial [Suillus lakei]